VKRILPEQGNGSQGLRGVKNLRGRIGGGVVCSEKSDEDAVGPSAIDRRPYFDDGEKATVEVRFYHHRAIYESCEFANNR
jgi:hypothetical protein